MLTTILFASLAFIEHSQAGTVTTTTATSETTILHTITLYTNSTMTSTTCTNTGGSGCPQLINYTFTISVSYAGPWGLSYQGYVGLTESEKNLVGSGSFYGHGPTNESVMIGGTSTTGTSLCAEAQKLDASNSTLILRIVSALNITNQTSLAYGTVKTCHSVINFGIGTNSDWS